MEIKEKEKILYQIQTLTAEDKAFVLGFMSGVAKAKNHEKDEPEKGVDAIDKTHHSIF